MPPKKPFRNRLNHLDPKTWLKFQKSWFIHNPPPRKKGVLQHPAKFPETLVQEFIEFFTKRRQTVLDPMVGTGSTLVACMRSGRHGVGIELNPRYMEIAEGILAEERAALGKRAEKLKVQLIQGDAVRIAVEDSGPGIAPEDLPRVFDRFYRGERSRALPGSGLGLAIVKQVVEAHGGSVRLWSREGEGTTVTLMLPAAEADGS